LPQRSRRAAEPIGRAQVGGGRPRNTTLVYGRSTEGFFTEGPCSFDAMKTANTYDRYKMNEKVGNKVPSNRARLAPSTRTV
jgi:hypothetical protein